MPTDKKIEPYQNSYIPLNMSASAYNNEDVFKEISGVNEVSQTNQLRNDMIENTIDNQEMVTEAEQQLIKNEANPFAMKSYELEEEYIPISLDPTGSMNLNISMNQEDTDEDGEELPFKGRKQKRFKNNAAKSAKENQEFIQAGGGMRPSF